MADYYRDLSKWSEDYPIEALLMMEVETLPEGEWEERLMELGWIKYDEEDEEFKVVKDQANPLWHMHAKAVEETIGEMVAEGSVEPYGVSEDGEILYKSVEDPDG